MYSVQWEELYQANRHVNRWPWTDLVSLVMQYARPEKGFRRVLELGCGSGPNIPFFEQLDVEYYSVEGSPTAVALIHERFPELRERVVVGDYTQWIPFEGPFDLVVDRSSLTCNRTESIGRCLGRLRSALRDRGRFIGVDWFSLDHSEYALGRDVGDSYTRNNFSGGVFAGTGDIHFFDKEHLLSLFEGYRVLNLQHKTVVTEGSGPKPRQEASWNVVMERDRA